MNILILFYGLFLSCLGVFSYLFIDGNLFYFKQFYTGFLYTQRLPLTIGYILFVVFSFVLYLFFVKKIKSLEFKKKTLVYFIGITILILFFAYPAMLSYDIFNYILTAKVLYFYNENPYVIMPIEFIDEPYLKFTHAANKVALYGPLWILFTFVPHFVGVGNFIVTLFSMKLMMVIFYVAAIILLWKFSHDLIATALFALNPLVVIETLLSSHNDIVMVTLSILSIFLLLKKRIILSIIFLFLSILIKYATIFLIPLFVYSIWKIYKKKKLDHNQVFLLSSILMFIIFLLSTLREEIYPWYAIWFLPFVFLLHKKRSLTIVSIALTFGLLLRYTPFILTGDHFGITPVVKALVTILPPLLVSLYFLFKQKWLNKFFR